MSLYDGHVRRWRGCRGCDLHRCRNKVVLGRGTVPCDVVFVGEGPGASEDVLGRPFVEGAPAGNIMQAIIDRALAGRYTYALTNLIGCIPRDPDDYSKVTKPPAESVEACAPRLQEFVGIARPKLLVKVGEDASTYLTPGYKATIRLPGNPPQIGIVHPGWIIRQPVVTRNMHVNRCIITIQDALNNIDKITAEWNERHERIDDIPF